MQIVEAATRPTSSRLNRNDSIPTIVERWEKIRKNRLTTTQNARHLFFTSQRGRLVVVTEDVGVEVEEGKEVEEKESETVAIVFTAHRKSRRSATIAPADRRASASQPTTASQGRKQKQFRQPAGLLRRGARRSKVAFNNYMRLCVCVESGESRVSNSPKAAV